jgi:hypothetical protein
MKGLARRILTAPNSARKKIDRLVGQFAPQAGAFAERFGHKLSAPDLSALNAAARFPHVGGMQRRWSILRHRLWFGSKLKNVGMMLLL